MHSTLAEINRVEILNKEMKTGSRTRERNDSNFCIAENRKRLNGKKKRLGRDKGKKASSR